MTEKAFALMTALGGVPDAMLADADPYAAATAVPAGKEKRPSFFSTVWFAAAVSLLVAFGVVAWIVRAGHTGPEIVPPAGSAEVSETERGADSGAQTGEQTETEPAEASDTAAPDTVTDPQPQTDPEPETQAETTPPAPDGIRYIGERGELSFQLALAEYTGCSVNEDDEVILHLRVVRWYRGMAESDLPGFENETEIDAVIIDPYASDVVIWRGGVGVYTGFIPFTVGETYLIPMRRELRGNADFVEYSVLYSTLVIPADRVDEAKMDGNPFAWYLRDVDSLSGMTVDDLADRLLQVFRDTPLWHGTPYLLSEDWSEIIRAADEVAVVTILRPVQTSSYSPRFVYSVCRVERVIKSTQIREGWEVWVWMDRDDYKPEEQVLIALNDRVSPYPTLLAYNYAAPHCIRPAEEADEAARLLAEAP